jgi:hypothetical protein
MKVLQFITLILTAVALMPGGAHLFSLPNKIDLAQASYFTVQGIYNGWAWFGVVLIGNLVALAALAVTVRAQRKRFALTAISFACQVVALGIFFAFVFPTNQATANWTNAPSDWQMLRLSWEYGHAASAICAFAGFCALALSVLVQKE